MRSIYKIVVCSFSSRSFSQEVMESVNKEQTTILYIDHIKLNI